MTIREWAEEYCVERGMSPNQAKAVVDALAASPAGEPLQGRWDDDVAGYPRQLLAILAVSLNAKAVAWIDANLPKAWYRAVFGGE